MTERRRRKLLYGKTHILKNTARITFRCNTAFLVRYTVLCGIDQILCRSLQTHYRKQSDRNQKLCTVVILRIIQITVNLTTYTYGDLAYAAASTTGTRAGFSNTGVQDNGIYRFQNGNWQVAGWQTPLFIVGTETAIPGVTLEHVDIPLAAEKNDLFFNGSDPFQFLNVAGGNTNLGNNFNK